MTSVSCAAKDNQVKTIWNFTLQAGLNEALRRANVSSRIKVDGMRGEETVTAAALLMNNDVMGGISQQDWDKAKAELRAEYTLALTEFRADCKQLHDSPIPKPTVALKNIQIVSPGVLVQTLGNGDRTLTIMTGLRGETRLNSKNHDIDGISGVILPDQPPEGTLPASRLNNKTLVIAPGYYAHDMDLYIGNEIHAKIPEEPATAALSQVIFYDPQEEPGPISGLKPVAPALSRYQMKLAGR